MIPDLFFYSGCFWQFVFKLLSIILWKWLRVLCDHIIRALGSSEDSEAGVCEEPFLVSCQYHRRVPPLISVTW